MGLVRNNLNSFKNLNSDSNDLCKTVKCRTFFLSKTSNITEFYQSVNNNILTTIKRNECIAGTEAIDDSVC